MEGGVGMDSRFSAQSTSEDVMRGIDLYGRNALVTGASSGLGVETARSLAMAGACVIMAARDEQKTRSAMSEILQQAPDASLHYMALDLSDPASILNCAEHIERSCPSLDLLINNAGVMACPLQRTAGGWEWQLAVNHIGHFLLTGELLPMLLRAPAPRVINLTSGGHQFCALDLDDPHFINRSYDKWLAYGQSKTANIWHALSLFERMGPRGLSAFAVHPGAVSTELGRHMSEAELESIGGGVDDAPGLVFKSIPQGAATTLWAATSAALAGRGGLYLEDCGVGLPASAPGLSSTGYAPWAYDLQGAAALWQRSEEWVGKQFAL